MEPYQAKKHLYILLAILSIGSFAICLARMYITHSVSYFFLNWNLFLAFIPFLVTQYKISHENYISKTKLVIMLVIWLLFFPNSPYILTDLFHLRTNHAMPVWFDLMLILSYAWTGLLFGFLSLMNLETMARRYWKSSTVNLLVTFVLFVSGFGVYIGRYLRWNSWDILTHPLAIFNDIAERFYDPVSHPRTWGVTVLMGFFLCLVYNSMKLFQYTNTKIVRI